MAKLTRQQIIKEIISCGKDCSYFLNNYAKITTLEHGIITFKLFDYQKDLIKSLNKNRFNIVLKARQLGASTIVAGYILWYCLFHKDKNVVVVANKQKSARNVMRKARQMYSLLPQWLKVSDLLIDNKNEIEFTNRSRISAEATTMDAGASDSISLLLVDEAALIDNLDEMWGAILPTLSTGGRCIVNSCVVKDTYIYTDKGPKEIGSFINKNKQGSYLIDEYKVFGRDRARSGKYFYDNGIAETRKITTRYSYLEGSLNHKVWAFSNEQMEFGWYQLSDLNVGDYVANHYGMNAWGNNDNIVGFNPNITNKHKNIVNPDKISKDLAYVIGLYISEGSHYKSYNKNGDFVSGNITFTCGDDLTESLKSVGLKSLKYDEMHHTCSSKTFVLLMEHLGFNLSLHAPQKYIPERLLSMSKENIAAMIQGIMDGDGCSRSDRGHVQIVLSSKKLIKQIRMLLLNFGILSRYDEGIAKPTKLIKCFSNYYRIELNSSNSLKYYNLIGFRFDRKQKNREVLNESNFSRSSSYDIIPNSLPVIKYFKKLSGLTRRDFAKICNAYEGTITGRIERNSNVSRETLVLAWKHIKTMENVKLSEEEILYYDSFISNNIKWDNILNIESGMDHVYDFQLPDSNDFWCHSVVYNGILGHQTPRGVGHYYHTLWKESLNGDNKFVPTKLMWDARPDRDQKWFVNETKSLSPKKIAREYLCSFEQSGDTFFDGDTIEFITLNTNSNFDKLRQNPACHIFRNPEINKKYLLTADVARGDGADNSAFHIFDLKSKEQIVEFESQMPTDLFASLLKFMGEMYNELPIVVENNNQGWATLTTLKALGYSNIYYSKKGAQKGGIGVYAYDNNPKYVMGFATSEFSRQQCLTKMEEDIRNKTIRINGERTLDEMKSFIWSNGKPQAQKSCNDDLIMSLGLGCWIMHTMFAAEVSEDAITQAFANAIILSTKKFDTVKENIGILPASDMNNSRPFYFGFKGTNTKEQAKRQLHNFDWLLK